jgi:aminobenzoyl-glutamate utilization protein B
LLYIIKYGVKNMSKISDEKLTAIEWIENNKEEIIELLMDIWRHPETAFREYRSAKAHCDILRKYGFKVTRNIAGMPTAFVAEWGSGKPVIGSYAEYDATPEQSQDAVPYRKPIVEYGPGFSDAHHSLGVGSTAGVIAAKMAMEKHGIEGTIKILGTPAEKVCAKAWLASKGHLDGYDAFITNHPWDTTTVTWETHLGSYWAVVFSFKCDEPEKWMAYAPELGMGPRHPGAVDAVVTMHQLTKMLKDRMLPFTAHWTLNEWIMMAGQMTADNIPPRIAQINYAWRSPSLETQEQIWKVLENCARKAAEVTGCTVETTWVSKTRPGLPNLAIARLAYRNLELVGPPQWSKEDIEFAREIQRNLGLEPMEKPLPEGLTPPEEAEKLRRQILPPNVKNFGSDDNSEFTWHAPCAWIHVAGGFE